MNANVSHPDPAVPSRIVPSRPLAPWLLACLVSITLYASAVLTYERTGGDRFLAARLAPVLAPAGDARPLVVILGDSFMQYATLPSREMETLIAAQPDSQDVRWAPVTRENLRYPDLQALMPTIAKRRPALIVIEHDSLVAQNGEDKQQAWLPFIGAGSQAYWFRTWLYDRLTGQRDPFDAEMEWLENRSCDFFLPNPAAVMHWNRGRGTAAPGHDATFEQAPSAASLSVLRSVEPGQRVLVVDVPTAYGDNSWAAISRRRWFKAIGAEKGVRARRCPNVPQPAETCDGSHYDLPARRRYAAWLAGEVAAALADGTSR
ncbi:MAG: hypothetical protein JWM80_1405 [Cyanobacteria bacterium RYN_339]|nr:hypothetical protein [Cyanobacteria bacterium RYN_339]